MNFKRIILAVTLVILLIGVASATKVSEDTITTDSTNDIVSDTSSSTNYAKSSIIDDVTDQKEIIKDNKTIKTASKSYDVTNYNTLNNALTNKNYDTVTVNIKSDITLTGGIRLNDAVKKLTINGNGKTISGNGRYPFLRINSANVTINNIKIKNCFSENGSAIYNNRGNLTIKNSFLTYNSASDSGGGIFNNYARLTMINCTLIGNEISRIDNCGGGAIHNTHSTVIIKDSKFIDNYAPDGGAILNINKCVINITNSTLNSNYGEVGAAIFNQESHLYIKNSKLNNNYANLYGGAIYNVIGYVDITNSTLNNNYGRYHGGAIYTDDNLKITKSTLNNNTAIGQGGAIFNQGKTNIINSTLNKNIVTGEDDDDDLECGGGAIYNFEGNLTVTQSTLNNNNASLSGGAIYSTDGNVTVTHSTFNNNKADFSGAIENTKGNLNVRNTTFNNNKGHDTGAIGHDEGNLTINNCTFIKNTSEHDIGAVWNGFEGYAKISNSIFKNNTAKGYGGAVSNGEILIVNSCLFDGNKVTSDYSEGGAIDSPGNLTVRNTVFKNNAAQSGAAIRNIENTTIEKNTFTANKAKTKGKAIISYSGAIIYNNTGADTSKYSGTITTEGTNVLIRNNIFDDIGKLNTKITVTTTSGIIGEKLTLKASIVDENNKKLNEGNVIFKLNGITIKDNGKLTGSSNPLKVKVTNGVATATVIPNLDMRNANKLTAKYVGTNKYNAADSNQVKIQVSQRNASIIVSSNVKTIKQGQVLTLTAKVYDTTNGKKSTSLTKFADEFVYFKVNGITLKDSTGQMLKVKIVNGTATAKYTVPLGLSGITDGRTMTPKNHTILAGFYNKNYQENIRNTSKFQVERSNITILIADATVNTKTHKLSITALIKDYLGNIVAGPNKCVIKINGISLKNGTQPMYYFSTNGVLNLNNINIPTYNKYSSIEIVTQDRLAYKNQRNTTTSIKVMN